MDLPILEHEIGVGVGPGRSGRMQVPGGGTFVSSFLKPPSTLVTPSSRGRLWSLLGRSFTFRGDESPFRRVSPSGCKSST